MADYRGPERRTVITFTREDSDRLVRLEQQNKANAEKMDLLLEQLEVTNHNLATQTSRVSALERYQSWLTGAGAVVTFLISAVLVWLKSSHTN